MGLKCSKAPTVQLPDQIMVLEFYDHSAYELNFLEGLKEINDGQCPFEGHLTKVSKDDTEFGLIWGLGLGRCTLRFNIHRFLHKVGVFVFFVDHELTKDHSASYISENLQAQLSAPARRDAQVLVVVKCPEGTESRPSDEDMVKDVSKLLDGCRQNVKIIPSLGTSEATLERVMEISAAWVKHRMEVKDTKQAPPAADSSLMEKIKKIAKAIPKKIAM